jgi:hypothetical protein
MISDPARLDLQPSCVNEVIVFNIKHFKLTKIFNHLQTSNMSLNRIDCTTRGLLMNSLGKDWITNI